METKILEKNGENSKTGIIKEEINIQIHWYLLLFFMIYFSSLLIPACIFMLYIMYFYLPNFLNEINFFALFTEVNSLMASMLMPFVIIICYLIHLFLVALVTRWFWGITEKKSPSKSGIIPRNIPSKTLNYYHIRSFMIKYPKNAFSRGPFPWLLKWMFNFTRTNKIGKGTVIEEQVAGDRFIEIGENCYIGTNPGIVSHAVEGIFGNVSIAKIKIGNNFTSAGYNCFGPGLETGNNSWWLPVTGATKYNILKGNNYYFGTPVRKIFKRKLMDYLQITDEDLKKAEGLNEKLNLSKKSKKKPSEAKLNE